MSKYDAMFSAMEEKYGLPAGYLRRTAEIESGLNPNAKNPRSSAKGLFQFIDSTARAYGVDPLDPESATIGAAELAADNARYLRRKLGREPTAGELYLAHQQGAAGAARLLANPNAMAADVVGTKAVTLNAGRDDITAGEFAGLWTNKFDKTKFRDIGETDMFASVGKKSQPDKKKDTKAIVVAESQERKITININTKITT